MSTQTLQQQHSYAANYITSEGEACDQYSNYRFGFDRMDYSRFKYGSKSVARKFGHELAERFVASEAFAKFLPELSNHNGVVIYPAPYNFVPTATFALKDYFLSSYNELVIPNHGLSPLQEGKIFRGYSYNADYGAMNKAERDAAISGDDFYIDAEFAKGKTLIFLDDIRVTGSHEERVKHLLKTTGLDAQPHIFLYYAQVVDVDNCDPRLENHLNYAGLDNLVSIDDIIKNDDFLFNTRVVKFILNALPTEFEQFIQYQSRTFRHTLLHNAYGNKYHLLPEFAQNMDVLIDIVKSKFKPF